MKKLLVFLFIIVAHLANGQSIAKYSNEFMNIGVDASAFGMGNAVVANIGDVNSGYWNPAGLVNLEDKQMALMHSSYFANIALYDYVAFAMPIDDRSAWGISLIRFGVDDILNTTQLIDSQGNIDFNRISLFSAADYGITFSYARRLPVQGLNYGINAKVIRRVIGDFASSWGFGFDLGIQFSDKDWKFGLMARDITTTFNTWSIDEELFNGVSDQIPTQDLPETTEITIPKLQFGVARSFTFNYDYTLTAEVDLNMRFAETNDIISTSFASVTPAVGLQFAYTDLVFLRVGAGNFQNENNFGSESLTFQPNLGIGFKYKGIQVDYALTDIGDQSAAVYSNVFSLKIDWSLFR
ncbi:PorV/PorQ family protein [Kordia sp.]|uniref:putative type IX sorting system protein PorV2 n=1 Tax=Kordia sp. TaxID=1965332 RepID=UPI003D6B1179